MRGVAATLLSALVLSALVDVRASTVTAASCNANDVQAALNQARVGDTVYIPAGTCRWTTGVSWAAPANVTLLGAGTSAIGGGDQTVIIDDIAADQPVLNISVPSTGVFRLSGFTFQSGSGSTKDAGTITIRGPGTIRVDHCHWNMTSSANYRGLYPINGVFGVAHENILDFTGLNSWYFHNGRSGTGDSPHFMGNYEWSLPTGFGTADFFFLEDNQINGIGGFQNATRVWDLFTASRAVARFNTFTASTMGEQHGTGHAPDDRGPRAMEVYGNTAQMAVGQSEPNFTMTENQTGGGLIWGNQATNAYKNIFLFNVTRKNNATYNQTATPNGWGYCGTAFNGTGSNWDESSTSSTGYACLDMPGRGPGDILTGAFPNKINQRTGTIAWPQQALEPIYMWANNVAVVSGWGGSVYSNNTGGRMVANRDYYPQASGIQTSPTSPFNGTSGTGWGTIANRPTTCTAGVGYWATDEGSWNTSTSNSEGVQQNGADGRLYKCTATNMWTLYYTPYTYPHPLRATGSVPSAPTNLRIVN